MSIPELYQIFLASNGVCTDSRRTIDGGIFFALKGDNFDGNAHAMKAIESGCTFAVIDDPDLEKHDKLILVDNVLKSLQLLANYHRNKVDPYVIGITGSNGKTSTKELLFEVISSAKKTHATAGNFNNHIGVPLTILGMPDNTEVAIIEMGANHVGEIAALCQICDPDLGIITNIGKAHLEGFGSYEGVIQAKSELYDHIRKKEGELLVCADDALLMRLSEGVKKSTYGTNMAADVCGSCTNEIPFLEIEWSDGGAKQTVSTKLSGSHNVQNILCAIGAGVKLGVAPSSISSGIEEYRPANNRSEWVDTGKNQIFLDAYNANPSSMEPAILNFIKLGGEQQLLILGDMNELGAFSTEEHQKILDLTSELSADAIFIGQEFGKVVSGQMHYSTTQELIDHIQKDPVNGKQILIKGSRGIALEKAVEVL